MSPPRISGARHEHLRAMLSPMSGAPETQTRKVRRREKAIAMTLRDHVDGLMLLYTLFRIRRFLQTDHGCYVNRQFQQDWLNLVQIPWSVSSDDVMS